jgi:hypothetical protein
MFCPHPCRCQGRGAGRPARLLSGWIVTRWGGRSTPNPGQSRRHCRARQPRALRGGEDPRSAGDGLPWRDGRGKGRPHNEGTVGGSSGSYPSVLPIFHARMLRSDWSQAMLGPRNDRRSWGENATGDVSRKRWWTNEGLAENADRKGFGHAASHQPFQAPGV